MDGVQEEIPEQEQEDESSWEVFSQEGDGDFSESSYSSTDEESGDEVLRPRRRKQSVVS